MNRQEVFNKVSKHLLTQKVRAISAGRASSEDSNGCMYKDPSGNKCAVGCLISENLYTPMLEGQSVYSHYLQDALEKSLGCSLTRLFDETKTSLLCDLRFLVYLQCIHDETRPDLWEPALKQFASRQNLTFTPLASEVPNG